VAGAQQSAKLPVIGFLGESTPLAQSERTAAFVQRLRELGWIEGRTVTIEYRWAEGRAERAKCGLFVRDQETPVHIGLRGGPGRIRTSNQTVMSGRPGSTCVRPTGVARKSPGPTGANGGHTR
jgi:hypothetical protein